MCSGTWWVLCVITITWRTSESQKSLEVLAKCALNFSSFKLFFFFFNTLKSAFIWRLPFWKKSPCPESLWPSFFQHLPFFYSGDVFWVYWHHYFVLSFPRCLKSCSVSNICLIPSKLFQNSLAYFQNKLLGMTFCGVLIWHSSSFFWGPLWFFAVHTSKPRALSHSMLAARHHTWRACAAAQLLTGSWGLPSCVCNQVTGQSVVSQRRA